MGPKSRHLPLNHVNWIVFQKGPLYTYSCVEFCVILLNDAVVKAAAID